MPISPFLRFTRTRLAVPAAVLLGVTAACSDTAPATAPATASGSAPEASAAPARAKSRVIPAGTQGDTTVVTFVVEPQRQATATFGEHKIVFSGQSICDPATAAYGPGTWELPCAPATQPVTITAKSWTDRAGRPHVDFQPALRFTPDDRKPVTLYLTDRAATADKVPTIVYCPETGACIDEARTDPELATQSTGTGGLLARRVKHFSGYHIVFRSGDGGDGSMDGGY